MRKCYVSAVACLLFVGVLISCSSNKNAQSTSNVSSVSSLEESSTQIQIESSQPIEPVLEKPDKSTVPEVREIEYDIYTNLDNWIGKYQYDIRDDIGVALGGYVLDIHGSVSNKGSTPKVYYAELNARGRMLGLGTMTIIQGNEDEISVHFLGYLPNGRGAFWPELEEGDVLFTLKKEEEDTYSATWVSINQLDNPSTGQPPVIFERVQE